MRTLFQLATGISTLAFAVGATTGCAAEVTDEDGLSVAEKTQAISSGRVVAYVDGSAGSVNTSNLDASKYTHINYAFANLDAWGNVYFTYGAQDVNNVNQLKALRNQNPNLKIILAIGGWTWSDHFSTVAGDAGRRSTFVSTAWNLVQQHGLDGIEIDWEFPGYGGEAGNSICAGTCDGNRFTWFIEALNSAKPAGKELSFAGGANPAMGANVDLSRAAAATDFLTIMSYDFHGDWGEPWGHHANLYGGDISVDSAVNMYLGEGVPASKVVVGLPFYGRSWNAPNVPAGAPLYRDINCNGTGAGSWCTFYGYGGTLGYDNNLGAAYINTGSQWVSFDNTVSMQWKVDYINNRGLGGAMYWQALQDKDNRELTNLIWSGIGGSGGGGGGTGYLQVDNTDSGFSSSSGWSTSSATGGYIGSNYAHDGTSGADSGKWARWTPTVNTAGHYAVQVRYTSNANRPDNIKYKVYHSGGVTERFVNQQVNGGTWVGIGTYHLQAGTSQNYAVTLDPSSDAGYTIADAVRFVWQHL